MLIFVAEKAELADANTHNAGNTNAGAIILVFVLASPIQGFLMLPT